MLLQYTDPLFQIYVYTLTFIMGAVMGSFLNCCAYRICHNMSIVHGRSECDNCGHVLGVLDLFPIFSYIFSGGKCRYCGAKIKIQYLLSEIVSAVIYVLIIYKFGLTLDALKYIILCSLMLCCSFADLEDFIIPDQCIIIGLITRIIFILISKDIKGQLIKSVVGALCITVPLIVVVKIMERILQRDAMGGGDIKLFFMLGSYFSVGENILAVLLSCIIGIVFAIISKRAKEEFPFGPSICLAYFTTIMFGINILSFYLSLF